MLGNEIYYQRASSCCFWSGHWTLTILLNCKVRVRTGLITGGQPSAVINTTERFSRLGHNRLDMGRARVRLILCVCVCAWVHVSVYRSVYKLYAVYTLSPSDLICNGILKLVWLGWVDDLVTLVNCEVRYSYSIRVVYWMVTDITLVICSWEWSNDYEN